MTAIDTADPNAHDHEHPDFLAHHWETPGQQFEAGKLGMWLFLATEFLLFGGLFCAYAVYRFNHPELFAYGSQFLNTKWGAINTVVLILSSMTMALSVSAAQLGKTRALVWLLSLTFLGGAGFMCIKYVEYKHKFEHNIVWGPTFYVPPEHGAAGAHGAADAEHADESHADAGGADAVLEAPIEEVGDGFILPQSAVPPPAAGPPGLATHSVDDDHVHDDAAHAEPDPRTDPDRPANAHIFFGIYFAMTGLHGIHVLVGMGVIAWLIVLSLKGRFGPAYFTPVDLGGLYWHVVDMIWIFLFPLLYLI